MTQRRASAWALVAPVLLTIYLLAHVVIAVVGWEDEPRDTPSSVVAP